MAGKFTWRNGVLHLGGVALYIGICESDSKEGWWEAYGNECYGSVVHDRWPTAAGAQRDIEAEVRRLLNEAGVEVSS